MASELRAQSGIDEALRTEGLADDIAEIRKLARGELDAVKHAATVDAVTGGAAGTRPPEISPYRDDFYVVRDREYPRDGADSYGALPDNAIVYAQGLPRSKWATDPLYVLGDPNGVVPEPEPPRRFVADKDHPGEEPAAEANGEAPATDAEAKPETEATPETEAKPDEPAAAIQRGEAR
jgi:hypothetical protein